MTLAMFLHTIDPQGKKIGPIELDWPQIGFQFGFNPIMYLINPNEPNLNPILDRVGPPGSKFGLSWVGLGPQGPGSKFRPSWVRLVVFIWVGCTKPNAIVKCLRFIIIKYFGKETDSIRYREVHA